MLLLLLANAQAGIISDNNLEMASVGSSQLRILNSEILELTYITTKAPHPAPITHWNFVDSSGALSLPDSSELTVLVNGHSAIWTAVGFKRRPLYAPLKQRDLRIGNHLYLQLAVAIGEGDQVTVLNPSGSLFEPSQIFTANNNPFRWTPVIHVNQTGYVPSLPKKASIGFYMGSAGELPIPTAAPFSLVETTSSNVVFQSTLTRRIDLGFTYLPLPYQQVFEADFSQFNTPGEYWLQVPGLGISHPFRIHDQAMGCIARTYALGIYHQRCGTANTLPFTRHTHAACHTAQAEVPTMNFQSVNSILAQETANYTNNSRHTAPRLQNVNASLYPFVQTNKINVSGGHHDAGDYSKYTINSAQFINALLFAVDVVPQIVDVDNLGIPESGDGICDLLQIVKWEADFLARMQDVDGGFYFLVYPRNRKYEHDVLPDRGDPQVVFPKTTTATAAAVAALAQAAGSPLFRNHYPEEAALYLQKARHGWTFLQQAMATHGRDGAYQKITHYGTAFMHDDELAWAAAELFLTTGESQYHQELLTHFDPADSQTHLWGWWRLYEGYGAAIRSYAFAGQSGRRDETELDPFFLAKCRAEIIAAAEQQLLYSRANAYGVSFPIPSKFFRTAGWFFPVNQAFDLLAGYLLEPKPEYIDAMVANVNFEVGNNPLNMSYLTGVGRKRQRDIVHQYAQNDRRILPPSGIPLGAI
ncbi:MAG: glycoside hydrolase family 9 protein, partial [Limisphaerales bacterium]